MQALQDAAAVDAKAANGTDVKPLCGLPLAVKDAIDVQGYVGKQSIEWYQLYLALPFKVLHISTRL